MSDEIQTSPDSNSRYQQWIHDILHRSPKAWEELVELFGDKLHQDIGKSLYKQGLPSDHSDDIEQETWLRALRNIDTFVWEDDESFYHWLRVISLKCIYELRRATQNALSMNDFENEDTGADLDLFVTRYGLGDDGVEDVVILRERLAAVEQALQTLKPQEREILVWWLMGEKPRQLALIYHRKVSSISQLLSRAKGKVEAHLHYLQSMKNRDHFND